MSVKQHDFNKPYMRIEGEAGDEFLVSDSDPTDFVAWVRLTYPERPGWWYFDYVRVYRWGATPYADEPGGCMYMGHG